MKNNKNNRTSNIKSEIMWSAGIISSNDLNLSITGWQGDGPAKCGALPREGSSIERKIEVKLGRDKL